MAPNLRIDHDQATSTQNASAGAQQATGCLELAPVVADLPSPGDLLPFCAEEASPGQKEGHQERPGTHTGLMGMCSSAPVGVDS